MGDLFQLIWMRFGKSNACRAHAFLIDGEQKLSQICTCQRTCLSMHIYCHAHTCPMSVQKQRESEQFRSKSGLRYISLSHSSPFSPLLLHTISLNSAPLSPTPSRQSLRSLSLSVFLTHHTIFHSLSLVLSFCSAPV